MAQDIKHNSIQLLWGMGQTSRQDLTFSPFVHRDRSPLNFTLRFDRSKKLEQTAYLRFNSYNPQIGNTYEYFTTFNENRYNTFSHEFLMLELHYGLGKKIIEKEKWYLSIGGKSRNRFRFSTYDYAEAGITGYYLSFGLDAWLKAGYNINNKQSLTANLALPLFSFVSRSPYLTQNDEFFEDNLSHTGIKILGNYIKRAEFRSWGTSQIIDFDLSYHYKLSEKWSIGANYWLSMDFDQEPLKFGSIDNVISFVGKLNF